MRKAAQEYAAWLSEMEQTKPGALHAITKDKKRLQAEYISLGAKAKTSKDMMDMKAQDFEKLWSDKREYDSLRTLQSIREAALDLPAPKWSWPQFENAIKSAPNKGKGTDAMIMEDLRILPKAGRQKFLDLFNECERQIAFPLQVLQASVMLQPKESATEGPTAASTGGDRALALLTCKNVGTAPSRGDQRVGQIQ